MAPEEYVQNRVDDQIHWYDMKSQINQRWYRSIRSFEIVLAASVPFMVGNITQGTRWLQIAAGLAGVLIAVSAGIIALFKFQESWIQYRTTCESLKHHKYRFLTKVPPYAGHAAFDDFVANIEALISRENSTWARLTKRDAKEE